MALEGPPLSGKEPDRIAPANRGWLDPFPVAHSYMPPAEFPQPGWWEGDPQTLPLIGARELPRDILAIENFMSAEQCALLRRAFDQSRSALAANPLDSFWDNRLIWFDSVADVGAKAIMQQARFIIGYRIAEHFEIEQRLYSDSQQLVLWSEGQGMDVHVDNAHPDGGAHPTPHRDFAAVLYLNDEYEGGEIFFPLQGFRLKASTGLLVAFRGSADAPHGVTRVRGGERLTMPCWYSLDPKVAERSMFTIF